ncbi:MAG: sulfotransferase domain-containing protein, partial [Phycisphaerales bacterium]
MRPAPDFAIIGAMKAATSTLHDQLAAHAGFAMSDPKEPCFFSDDAVYARGFDWYESCFPTGNGSRLRGDSSPPDSKLPDLPRAAARLHDRRSDARIVYVIRHPVDRLVSHFMHGWSEGWYGDSIEDAVA